MGGTIRALWRAAALLGHVGRGFVLVLDQRVRCGGRWYQQPAGQAMVCRWMQGLTRILALRVQVSSAPLPVPAMIVANHISWLDIIAIGSVHPAQFLAKDTVRRWPLIGALVAWSGTLFIQRGRRSAVIQCNQRLCHTLRLRQPVAIFPEGTTTDGTVLGAFHSALFDAPGRAYCPVQPLAIRYGQKGQRDSVAPFIGEDRFVFHLWRILRRRETRVELQFLAPISSRGHRRQLAAQSRAQIAAALWEKADAMPLPSQTSRPRALAA